MPTPAQAIPSTKPITATLTEILSHLVRFPTLSADHATNRAALDWVEEQLRGLPLHIQHHEHNGYPSLTAITKRTKAPRLWLSGHMDVVPGTPSSFKPVVRDSRLYGRGTHDMKSGIAVFITLLQELGPKLSKYNLGLMLTSDEEVGGADGVRWLLDDQGYRGEAAFMPDSGASWGIEMGSKGVLWLEVTATGRAAHASRPWDGLNAIDQINQFVGLLRTHLHHEPCGTPDHNHTTINFGTITGGTVANQVADSATARIDIRITPDIGLGTVIEWIEAAKTQVPGIETEFLITDPPYMVANMKPLHLLRQITHDITGHSPTATVAHGSSDARFFARHKIPTATMSAGGSGFHVPREWIDLADLTRYYEVTRRFVDEWCG
jgi:succinyl-diaminopimelate desuccinylase